MRGALKKKGLYLCGTLSSHPEFAKCGLAASVMAPCRCDQHALDGDTDVPVPTSWLVRLHPEARRRQGNPWVHQTEGHSISVRL